jgi:hypothetical protein
MFRINSVFILKVTRVFPNVKVFVAAVTGIILPALKRVETPRYFRLSRRDKNGSHLLTVQLEHKNGDSFCNGSVTNLLRA